MCRWVWLVALLLASPQALLAQVDLKTIAARHGLDPVLLYSVALAESARVVDGAKVAPWPWTIRSSRYGPRYFSSREMAETHLRELLEAGVKNIDVGLMQINLRYHKIADPYRLLDPEHNIDLGARILRQALDSTEDRIMAVGRYHSSDTLRAYVYGYRVWQIYHRIVHYFHDF